jgi:CBS domain-containing protein
LTLIKPSAVFSARVQFQLLSNRLGEERMRAHQIMTPQVITVGAETTIIQAIHLMLQHHIGGLPVVDAEGKLIGIVSEGDFIRRAEIGTQRKRDRWLSFLAGPDRLATDFAREHGRKVAEIMTPDPLTVTEDTPLDEVVQIMETHNINRVPVMRGDRLVGMLTRTDFLPAVANFVHSAPGPSADDDHIRNQVMAALRQASWRPCPFNVTVSDGIVTLSGVVRNKSARKAAIVAVENVAGVRKVRDYLSVAPTYPPAEEDFGGGDFVSVQEQPSTADDEPL